VRTIDFFKWYYEGENEERLDFMREKIIQILKSIAHISAQLQNLASALDKIYDEIGDQSIIELIKNEKEK
jgi:hypothetical protein